MSSAHQNGLRKFVFCRHSLSITRNKYPSQNVTQQRALRFLFVSKQIKLKQTINSEKKNVAHENLEFAPYADCGGASDLARYFCQH